ncbi:MAG TPA: hypothetical protein VGP99_13530 [Tepidisphaeraceae bacterium]|jgi:hypothetical protein|nr:hypothetical protein [Tepidisphaeraceae bacterium]
MNESTSHTGQATLDLSRVDDPETRRALRAVHQQMTETISRQQMEIEALVEVLIEKHMTSIGEFRRHMMRVSQKDARGMRLHDQLMAPSSAAAHPAAAKPVAH